MNLPMQKHEDGRNHSVHIDHSYIARAPKQKVANGIIASIPVTSPEIQRKIDSKKTDLMMSMCSNGAKNGPAKTNLYRKHEP